MPGVVTHEEVGVSNRRREDPCQRNDIHRAAGGSTLRRQLPRSVPDCSCLATLPDSASLNQVNNRRSALVRHELLAEA